MPDILPSFWQVPRESEGLGLAPTLLGLPLMRVLGLVISWGPRRLDWGPVQSSKPICHTMMMAGSSLVGGFQKQVCPPVLPSPPTSIFFPQRSSF